MGTERIPSPEPPRTEEEEPFSGRESTKKIKATSKGIDAKDSRAFWLTCGCLVVLAGLAIVDACFERNIIEDSKLVESVIDIFKYVVTTSLGFFFATTISRKE